MSVVELHYPELWTTSLNPHALEVEADTLKRADASGLVVSGTPMFERLTVLRAGYFGGYSYPSATRGDLQVICDFLAAWLLLDDHLELVLPHMRPEQQQATCAKYMGALAGTGKEPYADVFIRAFANVGERLRERAATPTWYRFLASMAEYFEGVIDEIDVHENKPVVRERYLTFRGHASGAYPVLDLIEIAHAYALPLWSRTCPKLGLLREHYANIICHANDIASHSKDVEAGTANMIVVLVNEGMSVAAAVAETARLHDEAVAAFDQLAAQIEAERRDPLVANYIAQVRTLARGLLEWQLRASRYQALQSGRWLSVS
ncbi:MAG TPA: terpene synthase family protein [Enhygromyxa sp.]|nr:terpene synthase family protein [Enhygromyxa sp.]